MVGGVPMARAASGRPKRLILIYAYGGWDVSYVFDPKTDVDTIEGPEVDVTGENVLDYETVGTYGGIPVAYNPLRRPWVWWFFRNWGHRMCVVNGLRVGSIGHALARQRLLTGASTSLPGPDLASIVGHVHGGDLPVGTIDLYGTASPGHLAASMVRVGQRSQLEALLSLSSPMPGPDLYGSAPYPRFAPDADDLGALEAWQTRRLDRLRSRRGGGGDRSDARLDDLANSITRARRLRDRSETLTDVLSLFAEPSFELQCSLAVDLLANDLCQSVFVDTTEDWDTHSDTTTQNALFNDLFHGLDVLAGKLENAGLWDDTLVVVCSEMTRTPRRNAQLGKDHWPHTSALMFGGGTTGGVVLGGTDGELQSKPMDLATGALDPAGEILSYTSFAAGILERLDVDPTDWLPEATPFRGGVL